MKKPAGKAKITTGSDQSKMKEIPIPYQLMEQVFDESGGLWYESEEEKINREKKEDYNAKIFEQIEKLVYSSNFGNDFCTDIQKGIFKLMFKEGLTLTEAAKALNKPLTTIHYARDIMFKNIKEKIPYAFDDTEIDL